MTAGPSPTRPFVASWGAPRRTAHAAADGNASVLGVATRKGLEHEFVAVQHVGVHRRVRRAESADRLTREPEQPVPRRIVQVGGAQRAHNRAGGGRGGHDLGGDLPLYLSLAPPSPERAASNPTAGAPSRRRRHPPVAFFGRRGGGAAAL